ncbi:hypothetical protein ABW20_dc0101067 [Dactylellina cionopaga]|nr:hypothetical protein ABW20_dc0101067 [Dactylellina cionopaga]
MGPSQSREQRRQRRQHRHQQQREEEEEEAAEEAPAPELQSHTPQPQQPQPQPELQIPISPMYSGSSSAGGTYPYSSASPTPPIPRRTSSIRHHIAVSDTYRSNPSPIGRYNNNTPNNNNNNDNKTIDTPTLTTALTYISSRLLHKTKVHHTFIVTGDILFSLFFRSKRFTRSVSLIQTSALTSKQKDTLISAVLRAAEKFGIEREDWVNNGGEVAMVRVGMMVVGGRGDGEEVDEVVARSLVQKEIVFSGDGMTLLAVDFVYELRRMLYLLSKVLEGGEGGEETREGLEEVDIDDMVELVRRLVAVEGKGRSLRREVIESVYGRLVFSDYAWMVLGREYERRFGEKGLRDYDEESDEEEEEGIVMGRGEIDRESLWTDAS